MWSCSGQALAVQMVLLHLSHLHIINIITQGIPKIHIQTVITSELEGTSWSDRS